MPVGPKNFDHARHQLVEQTCHSIDEILLNKRKRVDYLTGSADDYFYTFVFSGALNDVEVNTLRGLYEAPEIGWDRVIVKNSDPPGRFAVKLFNRADSAYLNLAAQVDTLRSE